MSLNRAALNPSPNFSAMSRSYGINRQRLQRAFQVVPYPLMLTALAFAKTHQCKPFYTIRQLALKRGVHKMTILRLLKKNKHIPVYFIGKQSTHGKSGGPQQKMIILCHDLAYFLAQPHGNSLFIASQNTQKTA